MLLSERSALQERQLHFGRERARQIMRRTYLHWQKTEEFEDGGDEFGAEVALFGGDVSDGVFAGGGFEESPRVEGVAFADDFLRGWGRRLRGGRLRERGWRSGCG
jgi:hypothetical protein